MTSGVLARSVARARAPLSTAALGVALACTGFPATAWANAEGPPEMFTTDVERCILPASQYHRVNQYILRAILKVESNLNPNAVGRNDNGSLDLGIGQMNSMHFKELKQHGVAPSDLRDACIGTYVAAWHLSKAIARHGNTWYGIATYHSATPYFNRRYQILLNNELVRSKSMPGKVLPVPPLKKYRLPKSAKAATGRSDGDRVAVGRGPSSVVVDAEQ